MANFMQAFEDQRENYLAHYGKKGMKWGVITSEYEPVGDQPGQQQEGNDYAPEYSEEDQRSMQASADAVRGADAESVKDKRKRIVKNIVKGVAIGAIVAGIAAGAVKGYAKKQTGETQDLATSIGIVGQKFRSAPGQIGDAVKKGFNTDTGAMKAANEAEAARKRAERVQAFKNAAGKVGSAVGTAAGKAGSAVGKAVENAKKNLEARDQARFQAAMARRSPIKPGTKKMDFRSIMEEREGGRPIGNMQLSPWVGESGAKKIDPELLRNRYNSGRGYYEAPRSRIYRG